MLVLVIGLGYVGSLFAAGLVEGGHEVVGVRRGSGPAPRGVRVVEVDVTEPGLWQRLPSSVDRIVVLLSAGERSLQAYQHTYVTGAKSVRRAFPTAPVLWVSSTAVYDSDDDGAVDDDTPARASSGFGQALLDAEAAIQTGPHLIVRPSGIYGPGRTSLLHRLEAGDLRATELDLWTNRIHRDDLVRCLLYCTLHAKLEGTLIASDQTPAQLGEMQAWVQAELAARNDGAAEEEDEGVPPVATAAARASATATLPAASPKVGQPRKSRRILPTRLSALGFSWQYPSYREGYRAIWQAFGRRGD